MIKRFLVICFLMFIFIGLKAQYGNEWINYSQNYYKIKVTKRGIYRITDSVLINAGIPITSIDPRNFQLLLNGTEQFIHIEGEGDGVFDNTDFIEFYAEYNDGTLDSALYKNTSFVPNPYYSLITDTAVYFLTWNASVVNKRMTIETDVAFSFYAPSTYFFKQSAITPSGDYYAGETDQVGGTNSAYTEAEGYFDSNVLSLGGSITYALSTSNRYSLGPDATLEMVVVGASKDKNLINQAIDDHHLRIQYKKQSSSTYSFLSDTLFMGYNAIQFNYSISPLALEDAGVDIKFTSVIDAGFSSNRTVLSYIIIKYPHTFDLAGKTSYQMLIEDHSAQVKSYLDISNFSATSTVRLYDLTNGKRIDAVQNGSNYQVMVPNGGGEKECYLTSEDNVITITSVDPVSATAQFVDYSTLAVDSAFIILTNKSLLSAANDYKDYRSTNIYGGLHNVIIADVDELYDQFAFGVGKSPLAIRGFAHYLIDTYPTLPQNLFLIGKSLHTRLLRRNTTNYNKCLVPSFGNPSSDNLLTAGLNGTTLEPAIPTGRLAAKDSTDVGTYLTKIIEYEDQLNNPPAEWKKRVLHFGGGKLASEQSTFKRYLGNYRDTIQNMYYGADVTEFFKTSSAPIQINSSDNLRNIINDGVSLMTFFGHASATTGFDQSIDDVNSYDPIRGHYPLLLANGCFVGDIHSTTLSTSETYLLTPSKGFIGYLGTVGLGVPYALNIYSQEFYNQLARKNYNKSIGSSIQKTVNTIQVYASDPLIEAVCNEMNLHGDPSLKLNTYDQPDYEITSDKIFFDLTSEVDSFTVYVVRTNIGMQTNDTIVTEVTRTLPNGDTELVLEQSALTSFRDTIAFKFSINLIDGIGLNSFAVTLDAYNEIDELNENNNTITDVQVLIEGVGITPVYPYEFAIIPKDTVTLRATTVDLFALALDYVFQFDTIDTFDSPFMLSTIINSPGGVLRWKPSVNFTDSTVYYWRVSPDSIDTTGYQWKERSFQYIINKTGWGQAHYFQFKNDDYTYVQYNRPQRKFDFVNGLISVQCHNAIYGSAPNIYLIKWKINNFEMDYWHCNQMKPSFSIVIIDPITGDNIQSPVVPNLCVNCNNGIYGEAHCLDRTFNKLDYIVNSPTGRTYLTDFLNNDSIVPPGSYLLAYSMNNVNYSGFEESFFQAFENFGSSQIRSIPNKRPYIMWGRKGDPVGAATEMIGVSSGSKLDLNESFTTNFSNGTISSPVIGPAISWGSFHWRQHPEDGPTVGNSDEVEVEIIGIQADGSESSIVTFPQDSIDILNLSLYIDAATYPQIRLVASMKDDLLHTPPQMERWQVIFDEIPEGSINPPLGYYISDDTLQEGSTVTIHLPFQNISETTFTDSLLFTYWNEDANGVNTELFTTLQKDSLAPNELIIDTVNITTSNYININALWMEVNPVNRTNSQLEQYHFNNILRIPLSISADNINPLLDVTFDGVHILDKDIVSAKPTILIKLKDENQFLALNDTSDFNIFIQGPSDIAASKIYFGSVMSFVPAVLPNNSCEIYYTPAYAEDGIYQLIVQAKDQSDNQSGVIDYKISFEIIKKSTITEVMNYPNPFSTSTKFVFTITGTEIPTYFKIQIMNVTGTVVREITLNELGYIHIGRNITEYAWNGKDEFGDQLANGVYLYRVVSSINGTSIERRESDAGKYFKKGFGKMYLMR